MKMNDMLDKIISFLDSDPNKNQNLTKYCPSCGEYHPTYFDTCNICGDILIDLNLLYKNRETKMIKSEKYREFNNSHSKNESFQQNLNLGAEFENYVEKIIFPIPFYSVKDRTSHPSQSKTLSDEGKPDRIFRANFLDEKPSFGIECKYHKSLCPKVYTLNKREVDDFRNFKNNEKIPIFVILGIGGEPSRPENIYLIPFNDKNFDEAYSKDNTLYINKVYLKRFEVRCNYPLAFYNNNLFNPNYNDFK